MILVDTSIWVDHLGRGDPLMAALLDGDSVSIHPYVIGEIALGNLRQRATTLAELRCVPSVPIAEPEELIRFIDALAGAASAMSTRTCSLPRCSPPAPACGPATGGSTQRPSGSGSRRSRCTDLHPFPFPPTPAHRRR